MTVNENAPAGYVKESRNEVHERRFACAAGTDERENFAGADFKINIVQDLMLALFGGVREANILKLDGLRKALQRDCARAFLHIVLGVEEGEDGRRCAHGLLEAVVEGCEFADRIVELEEGDDEGNED